jgi:hypothetical protein
MKDLDLPAQRIPLHFFQRLTTCARRQVSDQFPVDPVSISGVSRTRASITVTISSG